MARSLMVDIQDVETSEVLYDRSQIYKHLPQRHEFMQLDGIVRLDGDSGESWRGYCSGWGEEVGSECVGLNYEDWG